MAVNQTIKKRFLQLGLSAALVLSGAYLVSPWEGKENTAYKDIVGVWTLCYGETNGVKKGDKATDEECADMLAQSLGRYNTQMMRYVKVPLQPHQQAAFLSFTYNVGVGSFSRSTLLKELNKGNYNQACAELRKWVYAGGKKVQGLVNRREDEYKMCMGETKLSFTQDSGVWLSEYYEAMYVEEETSPVQIYNQEVSEVSEFSQLGYSSLDSRFVRVGNFYR